MKKITSICAIALAAVFTVGIAGCSSSSGSSSSLTSKWYVRTGYLGIQPTSIYKEGETEKEVLVYDISFDGDSAGNANYSLSYEDGATMTTEFYAAEYSWNSSAIPEEYRSDASETVYVYSTSFEISGTYTFTSTNDTVNFTDKMTSVCYFRSARNNLQPVYSEQYVHSTSPANFTPASVSDMCKEVEYTYNTYYNKDCTEVTTYYKNKLDSSDEATKTISIDGASNNLFDNSSVYMAMRSMNITSSLSMNIDLFIPVENNYSTYTVTGADAVTLEDSTILAALQGAGYVTANDEVTYSAATLSYTGDLSGTSQTIWYATLADDNSNNVCRSTMLKIELPLSFALGTLEFTLKEVTSHFNV